MNTTKTLHMSKVRKFVGTDVRRKTVKMFLVHSIVISAILFIFSIKYTCKIIPIENATGKFPYSWIWKSFQSFTCNESEVPPCRVSLLNSDFLYIILKLLELYIHIYHKSSDFHEMYRLHFFLISYNQ